MEALTFEKDYVIFGQPVSHLKEKPGFAHACLPDNSKDMTGTGFGCFKERRGLAVKPLSWLDKNPTSDFQFSGKLVTSKCECVPRAQGRSAASNGMTRDTLAAGHVKGSLRRPASRANPPGYRRAVREFCAPITRIDRTSRSFTLGMKAAASIDLA